MSVNVDRPQEGHFRPQKGRPAPAGSSRAVAAAYKGGAPFRQCGEAVELRFFETAHLARIIQHLRCITEGRSRSSRARPSVERGMRLNLMAFGSGPMSASSVLSGTFVIKR